MVNGTGDGCTGNGPYHNVTKLFYYNLEELN